MFEQIFNQFSWDYVHEKIYNATKNDLEISLYKEKKEIDDLFALFSPSADDYIEEIALLSAQITRLKFGNTIQLYAPLYISNECTNTCTYCGFNAHNNIRRITLDLDQIKKEAEVIHGFGFRHVLLLTGDHRKSVPVEFLAEAAHTIHKIFASVSIEVYPMEIDEYKQMAHAGVDGLTLYQETYNKKIYNEMHISGKKKDFYWRLNGPDRGGLAGFRKIGIGALLGISDWRIDGFFTALHGLYLTKKYWKTNIQISFPRLRSALGNFEPIYKISDKDLTHLICVMRTILPEAGLTISTRESEFFRDNILPLGITMMSAGSKTEPGGYSNMNVADNQFNIDDLRNPDEIAKMIKEKGFDPVWKDWDRDFII